MVKDILPQSEQVGEVLLKILQNYQSFAHLLIKHMNEGTANILANQNGIQMLLQYFSKSQEPVFINLIRAILVFSNSEKNVDVKSLFELSMAVP